MMLPPAESAPQTVFTANRRLKIGLTADRIFGGLTGIQHYVDNLLAALYESNTPHRLFAFTPHTPVTLLLNVRSIDGSFRWLENPDARVDFAGLRIRPAASYLRHRLVAYAASALDHRPLSSLLWRTTRLRARLYSHRFDILHIASPTQPDFEGRTNVVTIYDLTPRLFTWAHAPENVALWEQIFEHAQRRCSRVLTISSSAKQDVIEHLGIPEDRVDVTPLAPRASVSRMADGPIRDGILNNLGLSRTPFVLYAGTLEPRKNLLRLVTAFRCAVSETKTSHVLVLAGGAVGQHGVELRRLAERLGIEDRLIQTGYVSNVTMNALMSACDLFAYVSEYEGFGLPPLEAMTCGAPVVSSNASSLPEVVGDAGIQLAPTDVDAIAGAIALLLSNPSENQRRRVLSLKRAKLFSWAKTADLTLRSYEAAVS